MKSNQLRYSFSKTCSFQQVFNENTVVGMSRPPVPVSELIYSRSAYYGREWESDWNNPLSKKISEELRTEMQEFHDWFLQQENFKSLDAIMDYCHNGNCEKLSETEYNLFSETEHMYIWIRFNLIYLDNNVYIHFYLK